MLTSVALAKPWAVRHFMPPPSATWRPAKAIRAVPSSVPIARGRKAGWPMQVLPRRCRCDFFRQHDYPSFSDSLRMCSKTRLWI